MPGSASLDDLGFSSSEVFMFICRCKQSNDDSSLQQQHQKEFYIIIVVIHESVRSKTVSECLEPGRAGFDSQPRHHFSSPPLPPEKFGGATVFVPT
jgi:hypothetical protein